MDWSKAKSVLIIAFIITNIFLIYHIEKDMFDQDALSARSENKIKEVVQILQERGIEVKADVPMDVLELPVLDVQYITYDEKSIEESFLRNQDNPQQWELSISLNNKILRFIKTEQSNTSREVLLTEKHARYEAEKFLKTHGFMGNDGVYWSSELDDTTYRLLYKQRYKGRLLEPSYIICTVTEEGVVELEKMWLKPLKLGNSKKEIIPTPKALLKFMEENEGLEETIINEISLVYWLDLSHNGFTSWENVESGTAIPAWRIEEKSGKVSFIPAFEDY